MTFVKALLTLKLDKESLTDFRHQMAALTEKDKADLREWFAAEEIIID